MIRDPAPILTLDIEKPAAGGRMLARHQGQVVLVWGAIPGERVTARVDQHDKKRRVRVDTRCVVRVAGSPDVMPPILAVAAMCSPTSRTSGSVRLKGEIIRDAFLGRIGRMPLERDPEVMASPERGYRMRARLHVVNGRLGFYREESHDLCDAAATGQLAESTNAWIAAAGETLRAAGPAESPASRWRRTSLATSARVIWTCVRVSDAADYSALATGLTGLIAQRAGLAESLRHWRGSPT